MTNFHSPHTRLQVEVLTCPVTNPSMCQLIFCVYRHFVSPLIVFRLLVHRFLATPFTHGHIPDIHENCFRFLRVWVRAAYGDFFENNVLAKEFKQFMERLTKSGGGYAKFSDQLLTTEVSSPGVVRARGLSIYETALHNQLYKVGRFNVHVLKFCDF